MDDCGLIQDKRKGSHFTFKGFNPLMFFLPAPLTQLEPDEETQEMTPIHSWGSLVRCGLVSSTEKKVL